MCTVNSDRYAVHRHHHRRDPAVDPAYARRAALLCVAKPLLEHRKVDEMRKALRERGTQLHILVEEQLARVTGGLGVIHKPPPPPPDPGG
jgi:hypothetical protein